MQSPHFFFSQFHVHLSFSVFSLLSLISDSPSQVPTSLSQMCIYIAPKIGFERRRSWEVEVGGDVVGVLRCCFSHFDVKNLIIALVRFRFHFRFSSLFFSFLLLERFKWEELNKKKKDEKEDEGRRNDSLRKEKRRKRKR